MTAVRLREAVAFPRMPWAGVTSPSMRLVLYAGAAVGGLLGLLSLIGWWAGVPYLTKLLPDVPVAPFNASFAVVLIAVAWLLPRVLRMVAAVCALMVGLLTLFEHATTLDVGIDHLFVTGSPGRMSVLSAVSCVGLAAVHLLVVAERKRTSEAVAAVVVGLAMLFILGYVYDVPSLGSRLSVSRVATTSAVSFLLLGFAGLAGVPNGALEWAVTGHDAGAQLVRRILPVAVLGLPFLGLLCVLGERAGWISDATTSALIVVLCVVTVGVFTWLAARKLARVDRRRAQAIAELTELRIDLERQAQDRAQQLQRRHNEIAVLEDRQRIAADLHDIVIQRLFAAGMYLQSGAQDADPGTRKRVDDAVETMDTVIKDLRASIFELGARPHRPIDTTSAVSGVCAEAARVLGFEPDILIDDPDEDANALREDILAVLREALANVARHAEATAVGVVLRVRDKQLSLSITDNGKGIDKQSHRSGTRNMELRAREFGGACTWTRLHPCGTKVLWHVPVGTPTHAE